MCWCGSHTAAYAGHKADVGLLLDRGDALGAAASNGATALHRATRAGSSAGTWAQRKSRCAHCACQSALSVCSRPTLARVYSYLIAQPGIAVLFLALGRGDLRLATRSPSECEHRQTSIWRTETDVLSYQSATLINSTIRQAHSGPEVLAYAAAAVSFAH